MNSLRSCPPAILDLILRNSPHAITLWQCGDKNLNLRLSSGITELSLHYFPYKEFSIPKMVLELPKLKTFELYSSRSLTSHHTSRWVRLRELLPRTLEALTINSWDSHQVFIDFERAHQVDGACIPDSNHGYISIESILPSLRTLNLKRSSGAVDLSFLSSLPPSLTSLTVDYSNFSLPFMALLPSNLQYLDCTLSITPKGFAFETQKVLNGLANTPRDLVLNRMESNLTTEQLLTVQLPPGLNALALWGLTTCPPSVIEHLPRSLTQLDIALTLDWAMFSDFEGNAGKNGPVHSCWPPSLQSLFLRLIDCKRGTLAALPRKLKHLHITILTGDPCAFYAEELPPGLASLQLAAKPCPYVKGTFPPTLTRICCTKTMEALRFCAPITTLNELIVRDPFYSELPLVPYPPLCSNLLTITVEAWEAEALHRIPRSVTSLSIRLLMLPQGPLDTAPPPVELLGLPNGLTHLDIVACPGKPRFAVFAPGSLPSLTYLQLPKLLFIHFESIEHLPRSLKHLEAPIVSDKSDSSFLSLLPPYLVSTSLDRDTYLIKQLGEKWPPTAWRGLVSTPGAHHIPRVLERLHHPSAPPKSLLSSIMGYFKSS